MDLLFFQETNNCCFDLRNRRLFGVGVLFLVEVEGEKDRERLTSCQSHRTGNRCHSKKHGHFFIVVDDGLYTKK